MANYLDSLLDRIEDEALRADLIREIRSLRNRKDFGLVFERHLPETVRLYTHPVKVGATVQERADSDGPLWRVRRVAKKKTTVERRDDDEIVSQVFPTDALVVVREFGDAIYPGLTSLGRIERGGVEQPWHAVVDAENYHALETALYAYEGKVDCIYADPPYNSGARDWKYNNHYVDDNDDYRHSKWLAFMERRLLLAKRLLNPERSALIITIDEKEFLRLGLLLDQVFAGSTIQMVSVTTNPKGTARPAEFSRVDEYAFFVLIGDSVIPDVQIGSEAAPVRWRYLRRTDNESKRGSRPRQFYPVYVDEQSARIVHVGDPLPAEQDRTTAPPFAGAVAVFPVKEDGTEMEWGLTGPSLRKALEGGFVRTTPGYPEQPFIFSYLTAPNIRKVESGELVVTGVREDGSKEVVTRGGKASRPTTVWRETRHDAGAYGTTLLRSLIPGHSFPFPKSLYAVEDALRLFVGDNPDALVLDFFGGSGTTGHAVMRLNHQDGGQRRSVMITNNEVSDAEARELAAAGHRPGDPEWEALGIFEHITLPRITAAVTGRTSEGEPISGNYKFTDEFPMDDGFEENVEFLRLGYLDRDDVSLGRAFEAVAPLLWLKAGGMGPRIESIAKPWALPEGSVYGVLFDPQQWGSFVHAVAERGDGIRHAFVVTDSTSVFQQVVAELPPWMVTTMLYEDYLSTFTINTGGRS